MKILKMTWLKLSVLLLTTGCNAPEYKYEAKHWVKIFLTDRWNVQKYMTQKQIDCFLKEVNCHKDRFIRFGDFLINKDQIKAINIG